MSLKNPVFVKSAASADAFIIDALPSVIFAGRSNVGKSSLINSLLGRKNLAYVGATPGKTAFVNYFLVDEELWFVDLPGYGYAKRSKDERVRWGELIGSYFALVKKFAAKKHGILIIDARHGPLPSDLEMAAFFEANAIGYSVAANKCDKLKKSELEARGKEISASFPGKASVMYSTLNGLGRAELEEIILKSVK